MHGKDTARVFLSVVSSVPGPGADAESAPVGHFFPEVNGVDGGGWG